MIVPLVPVDCLIQYFLPASTSPFGKVNVPPGPRNPADPIAMSAYFHFQKFRGDLRFPFAPLANILLPGRYRYTNGSSVCCTIGSVRLRGV